MIEKMLQIRTYLIQVGSKMLLQEGAWKEVSEFSLSFYI